MEISYRVIRSSRKTIALQITPEGEVMVRCPNRMKAQEIQKFVDSKEDWLRKHMEKRLASPSLSPFSREELRCLADRARQVIPDCKARRKWLKENGGSLIGRLPK